MHYKNGRAAVIGDSVIGRTYGKAFAGVLVQAVPGASTCNGTVRATFGSDLPHGSVYAYSNGAALATDFEGKTRSFTEQQVQVNLNEVIHAEDALAEVDKAIAAAVPAATA